MIEKFNYELPELKCDFTISLIMNYQKEIKRKLNEIIDYLNNKEKTDYPEYKYGQWGYGR